MSEVHGLPTLPATWSWSTIKDACLKVQDGTHFSPKNQVAHGVFRYITAKNVRPSGLDLRDVSYLSEDEHKAIYKRCDPKRGDVLLVKDGVNTGDAALNTLDEEFSLLSSVCLLRPKSQILSGPFLRYFLLSPVGNRMLTGQMTGTAIKRIVLRRIKESPVPIAPLAEQQSIVAEIEKQFSRLDEAVAFLKRVKANLKRYRAAVLKAAVEGKLTEEWRQQHPDVEPASKLLERILTERRTQWNGKGKYEEPITLDINDLSPLPTSWTWCSLDSVILSCQNGLSKRKSHTGIPTHVLRLADVVNGRISSASPRDILLSEGEIEKYLLREGDLVCIRVNGSRDFVGRLISFEGAERWAYCDHFIKIRPLTGLVSSRYLAHTFECDFVRAHFERTMVSTAGQHTVNQQALKAAAIPLPPTAEQDQIVAEVERHMSVMEQLEATVEANLTRADRLRQAVLQGAFSGRLAGRKTSN